MQALLYYKHISFSMHLMIVNEVGWANEPQSTNDNTWKPNKYTYLPNPIEAINWSE